MYVIIFYGANQSFLVNPNCLAGLVTDYIRMKADIPPEREFDLNTVNGDPVDLFELTITDCAMDVLKPNESYYIVTFLLSEDGIRYDEQPLLVDKPKLLVRSKPVIEKPGAPDIRRDRPSAHIPVSKPDLTPPKHTEFPSLRSVIGPNANMFLQMIRDKRANIPKVERIHDENDLDGSKPHTIRKSSSFYLEHDVKRRDTILSTSAAHSFKISKSQFPDIDYQEEKKPGKKRLSKEIVAKDLNKDAPSGKLVEESGSFQTPQSGAIHDKLQSARPSTITVRKKSELASISQQGTQDLGLTNRSDIVAGEGELAPSEIGEPVDVEVERTSLTDSKPIVKTVVGSNKQTVKLKKQAEEKILRAKLKSEKLKAAEAKQGKITVEESLKVVEEKTVDSKEHKKTVDSSELKKTDDSSDAKFEPSIEEQVELQGEVDETEKAPPAPKIVIGKTAKKLWSETSKRASRVKKLEGTVSKQASADKKSQSSKRTDDSKSDDKLAPDDQGDTKTKEPPFETTPGLPTGDVDIEALQQTTTSEPAPGEEQQPEVAQKPEPKIVRGKGVWKEKFKSFQSKASKNIGGKKELYYKDSQHKETVEDEVSAIQEVASSEVEPKTTAPEKTTEQVKEEKKEKVAEVSGKKEKKVDPNFKYLWHVAKEEVVDAGGRKRDIIRGDLTQVIGHVKVKGKDATDEDDKDKVETSTKDEGKDKGEFQYLWRTTKEGTVDSGGKISQGSKTDLRSSRSFVQVKGSIKESSVPRDQKSTEKESKKDETLLWGVAKEGVIEPAGRQLTGVVTKVTKESVQVQGQKVAGTSDDDGDTTDKMDTKASDPYLWRMTKEGTVVPEARDTKGRHDYLYVEGGTDAARKIIDDASQKKVVIKTDEPKAEFKFQWRMIKEGTVESVGKVSEGGVSAASEKDVVRAKTSKEKETDGGKGKAGTPDRTGFAKAKLQLTDSKDEGFEPKQRRKTRLGEGKDDIVYESGATRKELKFDEKPDGQKKPKRGSSFKRETSAVRETTPDSRGKRETSAVRDIGGKRSTSFKKETSVKRDTSGKRSTSAIRETSGKRSTSALRDTSGIRSTSTKRQTSFKRETSALRDTSSKRLTSTKRATSVKRDTSVLRDTSGKRSTSTKRETGASRDFGPRPYEERSVSRLFSEGRTGKKDTIARVISSFGKSEEEFPREDLEKTASEVSITSRKEISELRAKSETRLSWSSEVDREWKKSHKRSQDLHYEVSAKKSFIDVQDFDTHLVPLSVTSIGGLLQGKTDVATGDWAARHSSQSLVYGVGPPLHHWWHSSGQLLKINVTQSLNQLKTMAMSARLNNYTQTDPMLSKLLYKNGCLLPVELPVPVEETEKPEKPKKRGKKGDTGKKRKVCTKCPDSEDVTGIKTHAF